MIIIDLVQVIFLAIAGTCIIYVFVLSLFALMAKPNDQFDTTKKRKFAIIIPAHNEELMISQTLYSVFSMIYPQNKYEVFVVADNCTDKTAKISRDIGATVLERTHDTKRGKGYALRWAFSQIIEKGTFDAVVVFDADSYVSGNFLTVMNYYLQQGAQVLQCSDQVQPQPNVWSSEMTRIGFTLYNVVRPLGRDFLNLSTGLRGNGMCFKTQVLADVPWKAYSLTEDIEYGIHLLLNDIPIKFAPEAKVVAKMPEKSENAESQRERWELGRFPIMSRYSFPLLKAFFKKRKLTYLDTLIDLIMPPMVNLLMIVVLFFGINSLIWLFGFSHFMYFAISWGTLLLLAILHLLLGFKAAKVDKHLYTALAHVPKYAFWKLKLYLKAFLNGKEKKWIRTLREDQS